MNAQHILSRWERVAPMLHACGNSYGTGSIKPVTLWLVMLCAARGPVSAPQIAETLRMSLTHAAGILRFLGKNGLIKTTRKVQLFHRPRTMWDPEPKLYEVLALSPMPETSNAKEAA